MKTKQKVLLLGLFLIFAITGAAFSTVSYVRAEKGGDNGIQSSDRANVGGYVLKEYNGYVAVYMENDQKNPITVTDTQVSTLRDLDKKLLKTGIKIATRERLMMTLEDLGS